MNQQAQNREREIINRFRAANQAVRLNLWLDHRDLRGCLDLVERAAETAPGRHAVARPSLGRRLAGFLLGCRSARPQGRLS